MFSPTNQDGVNDIFILTDYQSIRDFKITIFNRVGQVVHEYEGDVRDWEGWDGFIKNSGSRKAPPGNYFVIFEVKGWDNVEYNIKNTKNDSNKNNETTVSTVEGDSPPGSTTVGILRLF